MELVLRRLKVQGRSLVFSPSGMVIMNGLLGCWYWPHPEIDDNLAWLINVLARSGSEAGGVLVRPRVRCLVYPGEEGLEGLE